jgi:hypothetical protein
MKTKFLFYCLFLVGFVSIFLPFDKDHVIRCDFINTSQQEKTIAFTSIFENISFISLDFKNLMEIIFAMLLIAPFIFSSLLFFYKKYILLIIFNLIPLIFFLTLGLLRRFEDFQIGYYLLLLEQLTIFYLLINMKLVSYQKKIFHQV